MTCESNQDQQLNKLFLLIQLTTTSILQITSDCLPLLCSCNPNQPTFRLNPFWLFASRDIIDIDLMQTMDDEQAANAFLQTQFFFYLLPCYYGFLALLFRYFKVLESEPTYYVQKIPGQKLLKCLESDEERNRNSDALTYKVLPASYVIKYKLSLFNCYLYLAMFLLSFISTAALFYSANHKPQSFLYLFGAAAWYLAAVVLRRQHQRDMGQSIWIHRLFWILAGTFSIYKMFEDYFLPINLIINCFFIASNVILAVYGIYRPEDTDILEMSVGNDDIPAFIKTFFQGLELNDRVRWILAIQDPINENLNVNGDYTREDIKEEDLVAIGTAFKHSAESIKNEINLLNDLPRRNIFVDKKVRYVKIGEKYRGCFFILTQIGNARAEVERTLEEFTKLYTTMKEIFTPENFPKHPLPEFHGLLTPGQGNPSYAQDSKSESVQKWLDEVFKTPIFMTAELLQFLKVTGEVAAPFLTYFQHSYKMFCSKHYLVVRLNKQKKQEKAETQGRQQAGYINREILTHQQTDNQKILKLINTQLAFSLQVDNQVNNEEQFHFIVICTANKKVRYSWTIAKIEENILALNQKIEDDCNCSVPFFYQATSLKRKNYRDKLQAYRSYIESLLKNTKYYCTSLFFFIRFDPVKLEINTTGKQLSFALDQSTERVSRYLSEYEDKGAFIEVLRIDRTDKNENGEDILKFKLRRKGFVLSNKNTEELKELRRKIAAIYKGVSSLPELDLKNCHKAEAKGKIENFLLKIENLPKIEINKDYLNFYEHSLGSRE